MNFLAAIRRLSLRRQALVIVLSLLSIQGSLAAHQFEHDAGETGEACAYCCQVDSLDAPPADLRGSEPHPQVGAANPWTPVNSTYQAPYPEYLSRAPPPR